VRELSIIFSVPSIAVVAIAVGLLLFAEAQKAVFDGYFGNEKRSLVTRFEAFAMRGHITCRGFERPS
jgi:hypothetical protein